MSKILISLSGYHKNFHAFLLVFGYSPVFLEICSTYLTLQCSKCLFHMNKHKDMVGPVTLVEKFQDEMVTEKTFAKKAQFFFGVKSS